MAGRDLVIVIIAIIVLWILWFASGGPNNERAQSGPFLNPLSSSSAEEELSTEKTGENKRGGAAQTKEVHIVGAGLAQTADPQREYIILQADHTNEREVRIDNWTLRNKDGATFTIGKAAHVPYQGRANRRSFLYLAPGDRVYVVSGNSPIGVSFHVNKCSGYLEQFQDFTPPLTRACPSATTDALRSYKQYEQSCINFLSSLPDCEIYLGEIPNDLSSQCVSFIETEKTYNGCVDRHKHASDFEKSEWRVYLGENAEIWNNTADLIRLYNSKGKLVDTLSY